MEKPKINPEVIKQITQDKEKLVKDQTIIRK